MQFYVPAKYENINDRIKRLNLQGLKNTQKNHLVNCESFSELPKNTKHVKIISTLNDNFDETEYNHEPILQKSSIKALKQQLEFLKRRQNNKNNNSPENKNFRMDTNNESKIPLSFHTNSIIFDEMIQQKSICKQERYEISQNQENRKGTQKIKIQDILQSYNSYKKNKQQFIKTISVDPMKSLHESKYCNPVINQESNANQNKKHQKVLGSIQNTRQNQTDYEKISKIQKFKLRIAQKQQKLNTTLKDQDEVESNFKQPISNFFERPDMKNIAHRLSLEQNGQKRSNMSLKGLLSPRIPGKIIRNKDRNLFENY